MELETVEARIDALLERIELVGIELAVIKEHIDALGDKLDKFKEDLM
jgi:hypothetical protein